MNKKTPEIGAAITPARIEAIAVGLEEIAALPRHAKP